MNKKKLFYAILIGGIGLIIGFIVALTNPFKNTNQEIKRVELIIEEECKNIGKNVEFIDPFDEGKIEATWAGLDWDRINEIVKDLTDANRKIAKAKILTYYKENPIPKYSLLGDLWENRFIVSTHPWEIETLSARITKAIGISISSGIASFAVFYLLLFLVPSVWYFILKRIKELSSAIQGK